MTCQDFLGRHSEYMDGVMAPLEAELWRAHLDHCASCSRYDRVVRQASRLVRDLPEIEPSSDFHARLQHRIYNLEDGIVPVRAASGTGAATTLAVAVVLTILAWGPVLRYAAPGGGSEAPATSAQAEVGGRTAEAHAPADPLPSTPPPTRSEAIPASVGVGTPVHLAAEAEAKEEAPLPRMQPIGSGNAGELRRLEWAGESWLGSTVTRSGSMLPTFQAVDLSGPGPYSPLIVEPPARGPDSILRRTGVELRHE